MALNSYAPWILSKTRPHEISSSEADAVKRLFASDLPAEEAEALQNELAKEDVWGRLPLHHVVWLTRGQHVMEVFTAIYKAYPSAARQRDHGGNLPLHILAENMGGAEWLEGMQLLLEDYPEAAKEQNSYGWFPLHLVARHMGDVEGLIAMKLLLANYPEVAKAKLMCGYLPIHVICQNEKATPEMVEELLLAHPEGVHEQCGSRTPYLWAMYWKCLSGDAMNFLRRAGSGECSRRKYSHIPVPTTGRPPPIALSYAPPLILLCALFALTRLC
jgi:hypothetical protein